MYWEVLRPCLVMECKSLDVYSLKEQNTTLSTGRRGTAGVKRIRRVSSSTIEDGRSSGNVLHLASSCDNSPTSLVGFASIQKHSRQSSKQAWSSGHDLMEDNLVSTKKNLSLREHPLPGYLNGAVDGVFGRVWCMVFVHLPLTQSSDHEPFSHHVHQLQSVGKYCSVQMIIIVGDDQECGFEKRKIQGRHKWAGQSWTNILVKKGCGVCNFALYCFWS